MSNNLVSKPTNLEYRRAMASKRKGNLRQAEEILEGLVDRHPESAQLRCALGGVFLDQEKYSPAIDMFKEATQISPQLEIASLGLFHSLWESGDDESAIAEIKRFTSISDSDQYSEIIADFNITVS